MNTEEVQEELDKRIPSPLNDIVNYSVPATCYLLAEYSARRKARKLKRDFRSGSQGGLIDALIVLLRTFATSPF